MKICNKPIYNIIYALETKITEIKTKITEKNNNNNRKK